jgi:uncharacterized protein (DUF885 family)
VGKDERPRAQRGGHGAWVGIRLNAESRGTPLRTGCPRSGAQHSRAGKCGGYCQFKNTRPEGRRLSIALTAPAAFIILHRMNRSPMLLGPWVLLLLPLTGCHSFQSSDPPSPASTGREYERLAEDFVQTHFAHRPLEAVALGWHQYDGQFVVPTRASIEAERDRLKGFQTAFASVSDARLSPGQRQDLRLLRLFIDTALWEMDTVRPFERNPMFYANALEVSIYLKRDFSPLKRRVQDMTTILVQAPEVFAAARENLQPVLPRPFVDTAIQIAEATAQFLKKDVTEAARKVTDAKALAAFEAAKDRAADEMRGFAVWLKSERLPASDQSYGLGEAGFRRVLQGEMIDLAPEEVLKLGLRELEAEQRRFAEAARVIDPDKPAPEVFQEIQHDHPTADGLLPDVRRDLEAIRQFVVDHKLVTIASPVRAKVEETLPPFRATSFASMDTPGPFETKATAAYYYVTPVESDWTPAQKEEWLTAFNYYTADVVSIHEAYPGHYTQFLALNASSASTVAKVFPSYAFVEGWAHYAEQMMIDAGYGGLAGPNATRAEQVRAAKYRLAQSDEALLRICRLCAAVRLHCRGWSVEEATRFFHENCYYEETPAKAEAIRGTFDPGYGFYTLGKLQLLKLRRDWRVQEGTRFSMERFHDEVLRHGAPPIRLLRQAMLENQEEWDRLF